MHMCCCFCLFVFSLILCTFVVSCLAIIIIMYRLLSLCGNFKSVHVKETGYQMLQSDLERIGLFSKVFLVIPY